MPQDLPRICITPPQRQGDRVTFTPEQHHYLHRVLRLDAGAHCLVLDGQGAAWLTQLQDAEARVLEAIAIDTELPIRLTLIVALPKGSGFEDILRCGTELGVTTFQPVISDRTIPKPNPKKQKRWQAIVTEAAEQSERAIVPTVAAVLPWSAVLQTTPLGRKYLGVARGDAPSLIAQLQQDVPALDAITIATGPEGGWTPEEVEGAIAAGFQSISLGKRVLRAVTAPIVVASLVAHLLEAEGFSPTSDGASLQ